MQKSLNCGEILITTDDCFIETEAFRNVVVILWDRVRKVCGLCNYASPSVYKSSMATAQFGNVALPQLLKVYKKRFGFSHTEAYIFGGASTSSNDIVGVENLQMARKVLSSHFIVVASESTGGKLNREIQFHTASGECAVVKTHKGE